MRGSRKDLANTISDRSQNGYSPFTLAIILTCLLGGVAFATLCFSLVANSLPSGTEAGVAWGLIGGFSLLAVYIQARV